MSRTENRYSIRIDVKDGARAEAYLTRFGETGERSFHKIDVAAGTSSKRLAVLGKSFRMVQALAAPAALLGFSGALYRMGKDAAAAAQHLDDTATKLGVTTDFLQEMTFAAERNGMSSQALEMALQRVGRRIGEIANFGKGEAKDALDEMGISIVGAEGRFKDLEEILPEVADKLAQVTDRGRQLSLAQKLFDSEGVQFVNVLGRGADALERLRREAHEVGYVMDEALIRKGAETNRQLETMWKVVDVQLNSALVDLGPVIQEVVSGFAEMARWMGAIVESGRDIGELSLRGLESRVASLDAVFGEKMERWAAAQDKLDRLQARAAKSGRASDLTMVRNQQAQVDRLRGEMAQAQQDLMAGHERLAEMQRSRDAANERRSSAAEGDARQKQRDAVAERFGKMEDKLDKEAAAFKEYAAQVKTLDEARAMGLVNEERYIDLLFLADNALTDATSSAKEAVKTSKEQSEADKRRAKLLQDLTTADEAYAQRLEDLAVLHEKGKITAEQYAKAVTEAEREKLEASRQAADGIKRAVWDYADAASNAAQNFEDTTTRAFGRAEDAIWGYVSQSQTAGEALLNFWSGVAEDLARILIRQQITAPLAQGISGWLDGLSFGGGGGSTAGAYHMADVAHGGGMHGGPNAFGSRRQPVGAFDNAPRFHGGGGHGLGPGERRTIVKEGEITGWPNQLRHIFGGQDLKIILVNEGGQRLEAAEVQDSGPGGGMGERELRVMLRPVVDSLIRSGEVDGALRARGGRTPLIRRG